LCNGVAGTNSPSASGGTCASHPARPRADRLRSACLFSNPGANFLRVLLLMFGLLGAYSLIHILISRRIISFGPCVGAIVAVGLLVLLCAVSWPGISILGRGQGELAAVTFLGISLVVPGLRAAPGCEVMAIPGLLFGKHTELGCIIFSPLDKLERKLRSKRCG